MTGPLSEAVNGLFKYFDNQPKHLEGKGNELETLSLALLLFRSVCVLTSSDSMDRGIRSTGPEVLCTGLLACPHPQFTQLPSPCWNIDV